MNHEIAEKALKDLIDTIEVVGGVKRNSQGLFYPVVDEYWIDLGEVYALACEALGRKPMIVAQEEEASE